MGDFYELFFDDAKIAARTLGIALTSRDKGDDPVPMAGFPYHQLDAYLAKIIAAGHRAAICEQVEDPKQAKGIVKREVTRIVTPGTLTDDALLDPQASNFLAAIVVPAGSKADGPSAGIAWIDVSTGRFYAATFPADQVADQLARIEPAELLIGDDAPLPPPAWTNRETITRRPAWTFGRTTALETLTKHFGTKSLEGFGFAADAEEHRDTRPARRRRNPQLFGRNAKGIARAHRSPDPVLHAMSASRSIPPPAAAWKSWPRFAMAAATVRCWARSIAP